MTPASDPLLLIAESVAGRPGADAVLIDGGRVAAVGRSADLGAEGLATECVEGVIAPGFCDAHLHPVGYAAALSRPSLKEAVDFDQVADLLAEAAASMPAGSAVIALRLDDETLAEGRLPDRRLLDRAVPDRPAVAIRYCGHVSVANGPALDLAGIGPGTPDPEGGSIDRDSGGHPTGVLRETATQLVAAALSHLAPPVTPAEVVGAATALASLGLTSIGGIVDSGEGCWAGHGSELDALIGAGPDLPIRVGALVIASTPEELEAAARRIGDAGPRLRFLGFKAFADGSLGGHTAAMNDPFSDDPGTRGTLRLDPDWAYEMATTSLRRGGMVAVHAIGDQANGRVLDLMERLIGDGADPSMLRIEHASVLAPADVARFADLGVTAVVQPAFLASETTWLEKRVGPIRLPLTYAFRTLADAGVPLAGSSDSPVEPPHPLWGMAAARDRCGLTPDERLEAGEAHHLFTGGAAAAVGERRGIAPGAGADLVVLDRDPVDSSPDGLRAARVIATFVDGARVPVPAGITTWKG